MSAVRERALDFEDAWTVYRQFERLMPPKPAPVTPQRVSGLVEILDGGTVDVVILDAFGVLNRGAAVIPEALPAFAALRRRGLGVALITNDASRDTPELIAAHNARGFDFSRDEVTSCVDVIEQALRAAGGPDGFAYLGPEPRVAPHVTDPLPAFLQNQAHTQASGWMIAEHPPWDEALLDRMAEALAAQPRPVLVANPDVVSPAVEPDGRLRLSVEPGFWSLRLAVTTGIEPVFLGKPFRPVYARVLDRFPDVPRARILAVGDTLHTDVLGAAALGMTTLLVESGFAMGRDAMALCADCGIWPDYIAPTL